MMWYADIPIIYLIVRISKKGHLEKLYKLLLLTQPQSPQNHGIVCEDTPLIITPVTWKFVGKLPMKRGQIE